MDITNFSIALISPHYPPLRTSAAVQMRDLAREFMNQGYHPVVLVPMNSLLPLWELELMDDIRILRLSSPMMKDVGRFRRAFSEIFLPLSMIYAYKKSPYATVKWTNVIWYSPPIFFGPLIWYLKRSSNCRAYLILRDIFPEWAFDLGLIRKGLIYWLFKAFANFQYSLADTIGIQTGSNISYFQNDKNKYIEKVVVLDNWQSENYSKCSSIKIKFTSLANRKIFVYIGNMGIAQGMDVLIDLAVLLKNRSDIGFIFVGRGTELDRLKSRVFKSNISNILFFDEIDSNEIPSLLNQCHVGLIALDLRHKSHNIPGKFITYLNAGLPVLARINKNTDLEKIIIEEEVGKCYTSDSIASLGKIAEEMIDDDYIYYKMVEKTRPLARRRFSTDNAVRKIMNACSNK